MLLCQTPLSVIVTLPQPQDQLLLIHIHGKCLATFPLPCQGIQPHQNLYSITLAEFKREEEIKQALLHAPAGLSCARASCCVAVQCLGSAATAAASGCNLRKELLPLATGLLSHGMWIHRPGGPGSTPDLR